MNEMQTHEQTKSNRNRHTAQKKKVEERETKKEGSFMLNYTYR
jgi:hypothetical protein